eukprot:4706433-Amphidinium_carterae.1
MEKIRARMQNCQIDFACMDDVPVAADLCARRCLDPLVVQDERRGVGDRITVSTLTMSKPGEP